MLLVCKWTDIRWGNVKEIITSNTKLNLIFQLRYTKYDSEFSDLNFFSILKLKY